MNKLASLFAALMIAAGVGSMTPAPAQAAQTIVTQTKTGKVVTKVHRMANGKVIAVSRDKHGNVAIAHRDAKGRLIVTTKNKNGHVVVKRNGKIIKSTMIKK